MHRMQINKGKVAYNPNTLAGGCPFQAKMAEGGFNSFEERIDSRKIRARSKSFFDHFSQFRAVIVETGTHKIDLTGLDKGLVTLDIDHSLA